MIHITYYSPIVLDSSRKLHTFQTQLTQPHSHRHWWTTRSNTSYTTALS